MLFGLLFHVLQFLPIRSHNKIYVALAIYNEASTKFGLKIEPPLI